MYISLRTDHGADGRGCAFLVVLVWVAATGAHVPARAPARGPTPVAWALSTVDLDGWTPWALSLSVRRGGLPGWRGRRLGAESAGEAEGVLVFAPFDLRKGGILRDATKFWYG